MKYQREVMDLMASFPGRDFRRAAIVNYCVGKNVDQRRRRAAEQAVREVLLQLERTGVVEVERSEKPGSFSIYRWKKPQDAQIAERKENR